MPQNKIIDTVIIGAGVIGLAIARELVQQGREVVILEANSDIGLEGSFRNSAVIHAGIYYPKASLKAKLCNKGRELLYEYCHNKHIAHQRIGKLIVATKASQLVTLDNLYKTAKANGVIDVQHLSAEEVKTLEPNVFSVGAIFSPATGIVYGKQLMHAYLDDAIKLGAELKLNSRIIAGQVENNKFSLQINTEKNILQARYLINAAGLWAPPISQTITGIPKTSIPETYYAKGNYFKYNGPAPFSRLIYPLPENAGLGIHATVDLINQVRFGPDVEWVPKIDYQVSIDKRKIFFEAIREYFPSISEADLIPEFAGIRPKIKSPEQQPQDFMIQSYADHGIRNFIALYGIESPGLTASLAIGEYVKELLIQ